MTFPAYPARPKTCVGVQCYSAKQVEIWFMGVKLTDFADGSFIDIPAGLGLTRKPPR